MTCHKPEHLVVPALENINKSLQRSQQKNLKSLAHPDTYCPTLLTVVPPFSDGVEAFTAALASLFLLVSLGFGRFPTGITLKWKVQFCDYFLFLLKIANQLTELSY